MNLPIVTLDFETYYDQQFSLGKITTEEYIRSPQFEVIGCGIQLPTDAKPRWYDPLEAHRAFLEIDWTTHAMLCHNGYFDAAILGWRYGIHPKFLLDTMCMGQPTFGFTTGVSLASLARVLGLGEKGDDVIHAIGKHRVNFTPQEYAAYGAYCCNDVALCKAIFTRLLPTIPRKELMHIDEVLRCYTDPRLVLDKELLIEHHQEVVDAKEAHYIWAGNLLGCSPEQVKDTIMSNDKLATLLLTLNVDPPQKLSPTTGRLAYAFAKTDDAFLELKEHDDERVQLLVTCRLGGKSTLSETRAARLIGIADRGTLPAYMKYYAAHPGRLGGGDGINLQNLTRGSKLRRALMAPEQHVCVAGDLSQIEARVLVAVAGQLDIVEAFKQYDAGTGPDIYCVTATAYLGKPVTKAMKPERRLGKVIRLGLGYGMGVPKFQVTARREGVMLNDAEASSVHKWYRDTSERVVVLWQQGGTALKKLHAGEEWSFGYNGCILVKSDGLHLPSGRVLRYPGLERKDDEQGRPQWSYLNRKKRVKIYGAKVVENICQSIAGSVCGDAWLRLRGKMKIVLQVHDELVGIIHEDQAEEGVAMMRAAMTAPVTWIAELPVACDVGYARRYGDIEK
jgi:hypothetical protein